MLYHLLLVMQPRWASMETTARTASLGKVQGKGSSRHVLQGDEGWELFPLLSMTKYPQVLDL